MTDFKHPQTSHKSFQNDPEFELAPDSSPEPIVPRPYDITLTQRMVAACSGSLLTSITMTPLDVVRIRLQQQEILQPASNCCKRQVFWNQIEHAQGCKTEVCITDNKMKGTFHTMVQIGKKEGLTTLWRGLSLTLLMAGPSNIVYFTGYEFLRDSSPLKAYGSLNPLLCGAMARILAASFVSPIELIKTRLQSIPASNENILRSLMGNVYQEFKLKGPGILFKGLALTLWRDVPFSGIYWASYEYFKSHFQKNWNSTFLNDEYNLFLHSFLSGSISGSIAALATNPFDVGKTRMQISSETSSVGNSLVSQKEKSILTFMKHIVKYEGVGALYVGLLPRLLKIAPSCAIMISSYEIGKKFFAQNRDTCI